MALPDSDGRASTTHRRRPEATEEQKAAKHDAVSTGKPTDERSSGDVESYLLDDIVLSRPRANKQKFDRPSGRIARDVGRHDALPGEYP